MVTEVSPEIKLKNRDLGQQLIFTRKAFRTLNRQSDITRNKTEISNNSNRLKGSHNLMVYTQCQNSLSSVKLSVSYYFKGTKI